MITAENYKELREYDSNDYGGRDKYNPAYHTKKIGEELEKVINNARKEGLRVYLDENGNIVVANTTSKEFSKVNYMEIFDIENDERII